MSNRRTNFANAFWGQDFTSTLGCEALRKRLKEGKITCCAIEQYLRLRAKAEEDYSKGLVKACKPTQDTSEVGTLKSSWDSLKIETEKMAQSHSDAATAFSEAANRIGEFIKRQKAERQPKEEAVISIAKEKSNIYRKTIDAKKTYDAKSGEAEIADCALKKAKTNENSYATKEWDRIVTKSTKTQTDATKADTSYRDLISKLDETRQQWEKDMKDFCNTCEALDESRLKFLQNEIWMTTNIISLTCCDVDEQCEVVRKTLEKVNIDSDLQLFVSKAQTGCEKPDPIKYEPYQLQFSAPTSNNHHTDPPSALPSGGRQVFAAPRAAAPSPSGPVCVQNRGYTSNR